MKRIINKYLLLFFCIFSLVLPTGCEVKEQHGKEMGFASSEEYEMAASDVINDPKSLHKTEKEDGDDIYYKEDTNEFVVVSTDGYVRTYFNPDAGKKYFDRQ